MKEINDKAKSKKEDPKAISNIRVRNSLRKNINSKLEQLNKKKIGSKKIIPSDILEKMVSMENWLVQLNTNIAQSTDEQQTLALLNAKLEVLDDLAALQKRLMLPIEPDLGIQGQPLI